MKTKRLNFIHKRLAEHVRSRYELIRVKPTLGLFNFRCYENAVEYVRRYPQLEVHEVIYMDNGTTLFDGHISYAGFSSDNSVLISRHRADLPG